MPVLLPSPEEIEAAKTPKGAWTRAQLAEWGIPWPPEKGWKEALVARWESAQQGQAPTTPAPSTPPPGTLDFG
ncbi:hypothetical protein ABZS83_37655 [Streptomyces sp. NPDC005426]|uniref:hypothetical protein n=1 Tax=Streptomyces sp. NPDC005426 TaxID=3155344 RepID=UPI0033B6C77C